MTNELKAIGERQLSVQKQRAVLRVAEKLRHAYAEASERYGLTKKEFAERIGMQPSQFTRILNGRQNVSIETAEAVLRAFEARSEFSYVFLDDLQAEVSNRTAQPKFRKTELGDTDHARSDSSWEFES